MVTAILRISRDDSIPFIETCCLCLSSSPDGQKINILCALCGSVVNELQMKLATVIINTKA